MRRVLILLSFAIILLVVAAHVYRDQRVQDLFRSAPKMGPARKPVVSPAAHTSSEQPSRAESSSAPAAPVQHRVPQPAPGVAPAQPNQTPNETVSRVLLQILAAKGLSHGISLEVSDESIKVYGEVDSYDKRQAVVDLIEKGRENRRLDATGLTVKR